MIQKIKSAIASPNSPQGHGVIFGFGRALFLMIFVFLFWGGLDLIGRSPDASLPTNIFRGVTWLATFAISWGLAMLFALLHSQRGQGQ
jgi:hypothetical protein